MDIPSSGNPVISIGVIDEHSFTRECITRSLGGLGESADLVSFGSCDDCLQSTRDLDLILYHTHQSVAHNFSDGQQFAPLKNLLEIAPVIILSAVDSPGSIINAFENGARGYIPTASTTLGIGDRDYSPRQSRWKIPAPEQPLTVKDQ